MTSIADIQNQYVNLYEQLRNYIWDFDTVAAIANLEIDVYESFPDMKQVTVDFLKLRNCINQFEYEDEDLDNAIASFEDVISESDEVYVKLNQVKEVLV